MRFASIQLFSASLARQTYGRHLGWFWSTRMPFSSGSIDTPGIVMPTSSTGILRGGRDRAAWLMGRNDPLLETVTENLLDRLQDCKRSFPTALNLGGALHHVNDLLGDRGGIKTVISMDISEDMIRRSRLSCVSANDGSSGSIQEHIALVGDEEFLPLGEGSVDVVISSLGLHWVNDLPGAMSQCRVALKPDGLFLAAMLGGETLRELRIACTVAQLEREGGISPRISPFAEVRDAGNLLQRAGLALPTVDVDEYVVRYPDALELVEHLRVMGEGNAVRQRNPILKRDTALAAAAAYQAMFGDADGTIPATFQVIYMAGWRPAPTQQVAKKGGAQPRSLFMICIRPSQQEEERSPSMSLPAHPKAKSSHEQLFDGEPAQETNRISSNSSLAREVHVHPLCYPPG